MVTVNVPGENVTALLHDAAAALGDGEIDRARPIYQAVMAEPTSPDARQLAAIGLAVCNARRREWAEAEAVLQDVVAADPDSGMARAYLGAVRFERGDVDTARDDLDEAVRLAPEEAIVFIKRGEVSLRIGLLRDALGDFQRAARLPAPDETTRDYVRGLLTATRRELASSVERVIPAPSDVWRRLTRRMSRRGAALPAVTNPDGAIAWRGR